MVVCNLNGNHILLVIKKESFLKEYKKLDKKFNLKWDEAFEKLVNFSQTLDLPIHNWFYYCTIRIVHTTFNISVSCDNTSYR